MDTLPEELQLNILQRLPIKTIGVCKCVDKKWRSLINNPSFITTSNTKKTEYLTLWRKKYQLELCLDNDTFESHTLLTLPCDNKDELFDIDTVRGISMSNGLICFVRYTDIIMLWNPIIRKLLTLPKPSIEPFDEPLDFKYTVTLTFDSLVNDYKVIRFIHGEFSDDMELTLVEIFSLNANSWKDISQRTLWFDIAGPSIPILNGTLNWIGYSDPGYGWFSILGFDLYAEVFRIIELPEVLKVTTESTTLTTYKETDIAICSSCHDSKVMEVWVMKEYGNVESWIKIWKYDMSQGPWHAMALPGYPQIVGLLNNGDVLCEMLFRTTPDASEVFNRISSTCPQSGEEKGLVVVPRKYYNFNNGLRYFEESWALLDNVDAVWLHR